MPSYGSTMTVDEDRKKYLRKLIHTHTRRLNALELRAATLGLESPVSIQLEIEDIQAEIQRLENELAGQSTTGTLFRFLREIMGLDSAGLHALAGQKDQRFGYLYEKFPDPNPPDEIRQELDRLGFEVFFIGEILFYEWAILGIEREDSPE